MAFDLPVGFSSNFAKLDPIFHVEHVQLQFQVAADFAAVQVANNVIILALVSGRILRIDLANPQDVDGERKREGGGGLLSKEADA